MLLRAVSPETRRALPTTLAARIRSDTYLTKDGDGDEDDGEVTIDAQGNEVWISPSTSKREHEQGGAETAKTGGSSSADVEGSSNLPDWLLAVLKQQGWQAPPPPSEQPQPAQAQAPAASAVVQRAHA